MDLRLGKGWLLSYAVLFLENLNICSNLNKAEKKIQHHAYADLLKYWTYFS